VLTNLICSAIPVKFIRVGSRDPPFMTPLVRKLLNDRNKMRRKGRITEADELAQKINTPIVKSRASSLAPMGEASIGDLWRETGKTINIKKCSAISFNPDAVNAHFSNISRGDESTDYDSFYVSVTSESYGGDDLIEPFTVERLLNKLKRTSPGRDNIPSWVFKTCSAELSQVICSLFNLSLNWGEVPWQWRDAIVTPIPKVLNPSALTDYRPISVTPILSRMLEKIIVKAFISPALDSNQARNQFAYKRTGSSTCALIYITHWVSVMLETSTYVRCLLIDFTKAFDIVDHTVLLNKLSKLCLPPRVFNWIVSFLRNRTQVVKINSAYSSAEPINKGVIQGSGLGPALFSVMVNDLQLRSVRNILCKFADDATALSPEGSDISLEDEFKGILDWAIINKMCINTSKTKEIIFRRPNPRRDVIVPCISNVEIVNEVKLLGVLFSNNLVFDAHLRSVLSQCSSRCFLLRLLRNQGLPLSKLNIIFDSLILSRLRYAVTVWGGFLNADQIHQINAFLRRARRWAISDIELNFNDILKRCDKALFKGMMYSGHCLHQLLPEPNNPSIELRKRGHIFSLPSYKYEIFRKSFVIRCLFQFK